MQLIGMLDSPYVRRGAISLQLLDSDVQGRPPGFPDGRPDQAFVTPAVVWHFALALLPDPLKPTDYSALHALSVRAEASPEFRRAPHSEAVYPQPGCQP